MPGSCAQWASDKEEIMERDLFLRKYRIEQEDFDAAGVSWEELTAIADHYATIEGKLREIGKDFVDKYLYDIEKAGIHSYRWYGNGRNGSLPAQYHKYIHLQILFPDDGTISFLTYNLHRSLSAPPRKSGQP